MKLSIFTARLDLRSRETAVAEAAQIAKIHGSDLLVFPGWSLGKWNKIHKTLQQRLFQQLADKHTVQILAEIAWKVESKSISKDKGSRRSRETWFFRPQATATLLTSQYFVAGQDAKQSSVRALADDFLSGQRILSVKQRRVGVLLCGENNFVRNDKRQGYTAVPRHSSIAWPLSRYHILLNPSHDSMGQWNLLHRRFAYFSKGGRTVVYCTNNKRRSWKTALCVYRNGKLLLMGDSNAGKGCQFFVTNQWRLATVTV